MAKLKRYSLSEVYPDGSFSVASLGEYYAPSREEAIRLWTQAAKPLDNLTVMTLCPDEGGGAFFTVTRRPEYAVDRLRIKER